MHNEKQANRIEFLDRLRGIAICMVVAIHAAEYADISGQAKAFLLSCFGIAVPSFFMVDGYLFCASFKSRKFDYRVYLTKSCVRLLVPWVVFTVIYVAFRAALEYSNVLPVRVIVGRPIEKLAMSIYMSSISSQMYFLLSLFLIRAWTPALRYLLLVPTYLVPFIFVAYALAWNEFSGLRLFSASDADCLGGCFEPVTHALWGLQYYLFGACLFLCRERLELHYHAVLISSLLMYGFAKSVHISLGWSEQYIGLLILWSMMRVFPSSDSWIAQVGKATMGIYILHMPIVLKAVGLLVAALLAQGNALMNYLFITVLTLVASALLTRVITSVRLGRAIMGEGYAKTGT